MIDADPGETPAPDDSQPLEGSTLASEMLNAYLHASESSLDDTPLRALYEGTAAEIRAVAVHLARHFGPSLREVELPRICAHLHEQADMTQAKAATLSPGHGP